MTKSHKTDVVLESLDSFKALRMSLAHLRCIGIAFERDWRPGPFSPSVRERWKLEETYSPAQIEELTFCYHFASMTMHMALFHDVLCHYRRLVELNSNLKFEAIDKTLDVIVANGIFEEMRQIRNGIFHIRANVNVIGRFLALIERLEKEEINLKGLEKVFYDYSEFMFVESDIYQHDREDLLKAFDEALEYYKTHVEPNIDPDSDPGQNFFEARIFRPDKMF